MADNQDDSEEKTEEATPKRKKEMRDKGEVPRSRDLNRLIVLLVGSALLWASAKSFFVAFHKVADLSFNLSANEIFDFSIMLKRFAESIYIIGFSLVPFFIIMFVVVLLSPALMGGWVFSHKSLGFKANRLNVFSGIKKMLSINSLTELIKAVFKFLVVVSGGIFVLYTEYEAIFHLSNMSVQQGMVAGLMLLAKGFLFISLSLLVVVLIDVPFQLWQHGKKSRMSFKEVKDEYKETEGSPELKQKVRETQQAMANRRMMEHVPDANVIITNPDHYAIALKYDENSDQAPTVVAKGIDHLAEKIKTIANEHKITIVSAPPLARSIYYSSKVGDEIPQGLYIAVAKVLAYVYQLKHYVAGFTLKPEDLKENDLPIPEELKHD